jgi:hypothetical protein
MCGITRYPQNDIPQEEKAGEKVVRSIDKETVELLKSIFYELKVANFHLSNLTEINIKQEELQNDW